MGAQPAAVCRVCDSTRVETPDVTCVAKRFAGKQVRFHLCQDCGFSFAPGNTYDYGGTAGFAETSKPGGSARVGDGARPGREYRMMETALGILDRRSLEVLFFGSGLSLDHDLARTHPAVRGSYLTDLVNHQRSPFFVRLGEDRQFDVVICCEVVEHFTDPGEFFAGLLRLAKPDGIVVCSTNLRDAVELAKLEYPFIPGHVSYFSGGALLAIAAKNGMACDVRLPQCALGVGGPRKRYAFFFHNQEVRDGMTRFFARVPFAYSEAE